MNGHDPLPAAARIPMLQLDTGLLDPAKQFAAWAAHSRNTVLAPGQAGPFLARGRMWDLGPVLVSTMEIDPFVSDRTAHLVATAPAAFLQLVALRAGNVLLETHGTARDYRAPDLFLRDYSCPSRATASRIDCDTLYFQRDFIEEVTGPLPPCDHLPLVPETAVLAATLGAIVRELPAAAATSAPLYARTLRDLLAAALLRGIDPIGEIGALDRLARIKGFIAAQPPGSVTVELLVERFGTSRSVLYQLFRREGGVLAYDRRRRLLALYRDLADVNRREPIAALAARHGFLDPANLTRSFRALFGCTPREVRRTGQSPAPVAAGSPAGERVQRVVARLH